MRIAVLIFAAVVVTLGFRDSAQGETMVPLPLSFDPTVLVVEERVHPVSSDVVEPDQRTAHGPYRWVPGAVVRPRVEHLWFVPLLSVGLWLGVGHRGRTLRPGVLRRSARPRTGAELLVRLCVCVR